MELDADCTEGFGPHMQWLAEYFYVDDGLLTSTRETLLQQVFGTLTNLFDHVRLHTNVSKIVIMACHPCRALGGHFEEAYGIRMKGERKTYRDRLHQKVRFLNCNADLLPGYLASHIQAHYGVARGHHRVAHQLARMNLRRGMVIRWVYRFLYEAIMAVGLEEVEMYVLHRKNTVAQYITPRPILEFYLAEEQHPGAQVTMRWLYQGGINLGQEYTEKDTYTEREKKDD